MVHGEFSFVFFSAKLIHYLKYFNKIVANYHPVKVQTNSGPLKGYCSISNQANLFQNQSLVISIIIKVSPVI